MNTRNPGRKLCHLTLPCRVVDIPLATWRCLISVKTVFSIFAWNADWSPNIRVHLDFFCENFRFQVFSLTGILEFMLSQNHAWLTLMQLIAWIFQINHSRLDVIFLQNFISEPVSLNFPLFFLFFPPKPFLLFAVDPVGVNYFGFLTSFSFQTSLLLKLDFIFPFLTRFKQKLFFLLSNFLLFENPLVSFSLLLQ